jgi:hypothetical protein
MKRCVGKITSDKRIYRKLELYQLKLVEGAPDLTGFLDQRDREIFV